MLRSWPTGKTAPKTVVEWKPVHFGLMTAGNNCKKDYNKFLSTHPVKGSTLLVEDSGSWKYQRRRGRRGKLREGSTLHKWVLLWIIQKSKNGSQGGKKMVTPRATNGSLTKIGILGPKKNSLLEAHHVLATTGKSCSKKKVAFAQIIITQNIILGDFLG